MRVFYWSFCGCGDRLFTFPRDDSELFATPDIAMLRWIDFIKSLNPEFHHIAGRDNPMADMLSRARYEDEEEMVMVEDDVGLKFYSSSHLHANCCSNAHALEFSDESMHEGEWFLIGSYLSTLTRQEDWSNAEFRKIRKKAYGYFLRDGHLWKRPKQPKGIPQRVVCDKVTQQHVLKEFHESLWAGHRGIWATFAKVKDRYWWKGMYKDVV